MKTFAQYLQHPILKLVFAPLSYIIFGIGMGISGSINFIQILLLFSITFIDHLISHFLFQKNDLKRTKTMSNSIFMFLEIALLVLGFIFILNHPWTLNILLILSIMATHVIYLPYNFSLSGLHFILLNFFRAFIWNIIAYYSLTHHVNTNFIKLLIPIVIFSIGLAILEFDTMKVMTFKKKFITKIPAHYLTITLGIIAIIFGFTKSLPSGTFFIVEILFVILSMLLLVPIFFNPNSNKQPQNKLNYLSSSLFIFNILYLFANLT